MIKIHTLDRDKNDFHAKLKQINQISHREHYFYSKSYSGNILVIVENSNGKIGVDIEKYVPRSVETINFFLKRYSSFEIINCEEISLTTFYKVWTAMESYYKYMGKGFYTEKKFILDLKNKVVKNFSECIHFDYVNIAGYTVCVCLKNIEDFSDIKILADS